MTNMWGVHNDTLTTELVDGGFVSVGWGPVPDLHSLGTTREEVKTSLTQIYPDRTSGAIAAWAGILLRFRDEVQVGDIVVAPYKPDRTVNIGVVTSGYYYDTSAPEHRHRRRVEWRRTGVPRVDFSPAARDALSRLQTVFAIRTATDEFVAAINASIATAPHAAGSTLMEVPNPEPAPDEIRASRIREHTHDFVLERLLKSIDHREFEEFTADLLRALGYQARVTTFTHDGGVDVIAHRDPLGVEPPLIKVQCKHLVATVGSPDVNRLAGTLAKAELGVFVTLGGYSGDALALERTRSELRLLTGEDVVSLFLAHYPQMGAKWRALIPLTPILVVDDSADV